MAQSHQESAQWFWQVPSDAADFLSGDVARVAYGEPLDLGPRLGPALVDPVAASDFDEEP